MRRSEKLQQLHDRLDAHVAEHGDNGMVTKRDLRDLLAAWLSEDAASSGPAKDVEAAVANLGSPGADTYAPDWFRRDLRIVLAELARLRGR